MTAIEKNELTLINPTIVSIDLDMSFISKISRTSGLQWNVNREIPIKTTAGVVVRSSNKFKIPTYANQREFWYNIIPQRCKVHPGLHLVCDFDRTFNGAGNRMRAKRIFKKNRVRNCSRTSKFQLPPSVVQSEENAVVEVVFGIRRNKCLRPLSANGELNRVTCEGNITCLQILTQLAVEKRRWKQKSETRLY